jgi:hypothetical protein
LDRRLGRPQNSSGRGGEEKNSQPPQEIITIIIIKIITATTIMQTGIRGSNFNGMYVVIN